MRVRPNIISPEEAERRIGASPGLLRMVQTELNRMLNDTEFKRRVDDAFSKGRISGVDGFDWYPDAGVKEER